MDTSHTHEIIEGTPESASILFNESGYVSATPSLLYDDSSESVGDLSSRRPTIQYISETPLTSQKYCKINSHRRLLQEKCYSSKFSENLTEQVKNSSYYSCVPVENDTEHNTSLVSEGSGALAECFSNLLVGESSCDTSEKAQVHIETNSELFCSGSRVAKLSLNSKNKCSSDHESVSVKKFKQDYSCAPLSERSHQNSYCGTSYLDIFVHLAGASGCFPGIISQIFSYLCPQDLVTFCKVSPEWREVCVGDPAANRRRLAYVNHVKQSKENATLNEVKLTRQSLNLSLSSNKGLFKEIQNTERRDSNTSTPPSTPRSPPVSPSKVRFNLFMKAGFALDEGTHLIRCPRCTHPSQVTSLEANCQAVGCRYNFCVSCFCDTHDGQPCPSRSVLPVRRKATRVGSKESRRNLRRL